MKKAAQTGGENKKETTNPHPSNADGGYFWVFLVSNINCLPLFLLICNSLRTCRQRSGFRFKFLFP